MPTHFDTLFADGDIVEAHQVQQYADPVNKIEPGAAFYREDIGSTANTNAYKVDFSSENPITAYTPGILVNFLAQTSNTGEATMEIHGPGGDLGAKPLSKGGQPLAAGDLQAGVIVSVVYNGSGSGSFDVIGVSSSGGASGSGNSLSDLTGGTLAAPLNLPNDQIVTPEITAIVGTSAGPVYNVAPGLNHFFKVDGNELVTIGAEQVVSSVPLNMGSNDITAVRNLEMSGPLVQSYDVTSIMSRIAARTDNGGTLQLAGGSGFAQANGAFMKLCGAENTPDQGNLFLLSLIHI